MKFYLFLFGCAMLLPLLSGCSRFVSHPAAGDAGTSRAGARFQPMTLPHLAPRPEWWRVRPSEIIERCRTVRKGTPRIIAESAAGSPVYAVFYGDFSEEPHAANWSAASGSGDPAAYTGETGGGKQTVLFLAGMHGAEAESVAAAVNLLEFMETGRDLRGRSHPELAELLRQYRLIILPCLNMDGRAISPDHLNGSTYEEFRRASQGVWLDGSLIGWKGSKKFFPLPLDRVSYPGGYPNAAGVNIMHDATPGNIRSAEARGLLRLTEQYTVDLVLNGHSCEYPAMMFAPSEYNYGPNLRRGRELARSVNDALLKAGLRREPYRISEKPDRSVNIDNLIPLTCGGLALTLECNVYGPDFDTLVEPNFVALETLLREGLRKPFVDRKKLLSGIPEY